MSDRPKHPNEPREQNKERDDDYAEENFVNRQLLGVEVQNTHLAFGSLQNRFVTNLIVIHHIGNTNDDVSASTVHNWHKKQGWSGIGYHFLIRKNGTIEQGRPMDTVGAHAYGSNKRSIGINIVGNFEHATPTEAQMESAIELVTALCKLYRIRPSSRTIVGHRDVTSTLCPGRTLYSALPLLRQAVQDRLGVTDMRSGKTRREKMEKDNTEWEKVEADDTERNGGVEDEHVSQHEERKVSRRGGSRKTLAGGKKDI